MFVPVKGKMDFTFTTDRNNLYGDWYANTTPIDPSHTFNPVWLGQSGDDVVMLAQFGERLYRSEDNGTSWNRILGLFLGEEPALAFTTKNPNKNRSVFVSKANGELYRSTDLTSDAGSGWELVLTPASGRFSFRYGLSVNDNIILLSTYGLSNTENPPRMVYLSKDYGETWTKIFDKPLEEMPNIERYHIHDIKYDPWGSRIWMATGDDLNGNVHYSDNWGATWQTVYSKGGMIQPTVIIPLPDRVLFGSDDRPNGFRVWYRDMKRQGKKVTANDISVLYTPTDYPGLDLRNVCNQNQMDMTLMTTVYPYVLLIPFSAEGTNPGRLLASGDGENWFEVWRTDLVPGSVSGPFAKVLGPVPNDPNRTIYLQQYSTQLATNIYVKGHLPEFIKIER